VYNHLHTYLVHMMVNGTRLIINNYHIKLCVYIAIRFHFLHIMFIGLLKSIYKYTNHITIT